MSKSFSRFIPAVVAAFLIASLVGIYMYAKSQGIDVLEPQGYIAAHQRELFMLAIILAAICLIPVFILTYAIVHRHHQGNPHATNRYSRFWQVKPEASVIWAAFISSIIAALAIVMIYSTVTVDPYRPLDSHQPSKVIQVVALPWKWLFIYPEEGIATINELAIPVDQPITFQLTADSPMSSFWIPKLGGMIYTMEGMTTQLNLVATSPGQFEGKNTEINGKGYASMKFQTKALSIQDYQQWVEDVRRSPQMLDDDTYYHLTQDSVADPVQKFAMIHSHNLFNRIIAQFTEPNAKIQPVSLSPSTESTSHPHSH